MGRMLTVLCAGSVVITSALARTVELAPGMTSLAHPLTLTASDSGTRFVGAADGTTVLSGGVPITGWTAREDGVWVARAPFYFEALFVNGRRAVRARAPNTGFFQARDLASEENGTCGVGLLPAEATLLAQVPAADLPFVHLVAHVKWDLYRRPLTSFNASSSRVRIAGVSASKLDAQEQFYFENLRSAFDAPGEWFYDGVAGEVLYRPLPGERLDWLEAIAPRQGLETLVAIDGAEDVTFENVTFAHSTPSEQMGPSSYDSYQAAVATPATVKVNHARRIVFRNCAFRHIGAYGMHLETDCSSNRVESCLFDDLGAGGMKIGPFANPGASGAVVQPPAATSFNLVTNCVFRRGGRHTESGVGVIIAHASDNTVVKNTIEDFYYTGISVGWVWGYAGSVAQRNQIGFNRIRKIGQRALSDMGGIYTLGTSFGTRLFNNVISDIDSYSYGGWGIYPDEGSEGLTVENNLVYDTMDASLHQHYGRANVIRNNIFGFSRQCQVAVTRVESHLSMKVENNILYWQSGDAFGTRYTGIKNGAQIEWRSNLWWCVESAPRYNGATYAQWTSGGRDAGGAVADPLFVDASERDFRLQPESPAFAMGFKSFDPAAAGADLLVEDEHVLPEATVAIAGPVTVGPGFASVSVPVTAQVLSYGRGASFARRYSSARVVVRLTPVTGGESRVCTFTIAGDQDAHEFTAAFEGVEPGISYDVVVQVKMGDEETELQTDQTAVTTARSVAWIAERAATFPHARWTLPATGAHVANGRISLVREVGEIHDTLTYTPTGGVECAEVNLCTRLYCALLPEVVESYHPESAGLTLVGTTNAPAHFAVWGAGKWNVTGVEEPADNVSAEYDVKILIDRRVGRVAYRVRPVNGQWIDLGAYEIAAERGPIRQIDFVGSVDLAQMDGVCLDANLVKTDDGTEYADFSSALAAGATGVLTPLWPSVWNLPAASGVFELRDVQQAVSFGGAATVLKTEDRGNGVVRCWYARLPAGVDRARAAKYAPATVALGLVDAMTDGSVVKLGNYLVANGEMSFSVSIDDVEVTQAAIKDFVEVKASLTDEWMKPADADIRFTLDEAGRGKVFVVPNRKGTGGFTRVRILEEKD